MTINGLSFQFHIKHFACLMLTIPVHKATKFLVLEKYSTINTENGLCNPLSIDPRVKKWLGDNFIPNNLFQIKYRGFKRQYHLWGFLGVNGDGGFGNFYITPKNPHKPPKTPIDLQKPQFGLNIQKFYFDIN